MSNIGVHVTRVISVSGLVTVDCHWVTLPRTDVSRSSARRAGNLLPDGGKQTEDGEMSEKEKLQKNKDLLKEDEKRTERGIHPGVRRG